MSRIEEIRIRWTKSDEVYKRMSTGEWLELHSHALSDIDYLLRRVNEGSAETKENA